MRTWLRRLRAALGMGVTWALAWGFVGGLIELALNIFPNLPLPSIDMWIQTLAMPGFLGGLAFSSLLRVGEGRRRFDELSLSRFGAWGAAGGLAVGALVAFALGQGLPREALVAILGTTGVLGAASATGTLALARMSEDRDLLREGQEAGEVGLTPGEIQDLLERGR